MKFKPTKKTGGLTVELKPRESIPQSTAKKRVTASPSFSVKRILVPIDFSDCSNKALQYALPFAEQFDAKILLLHVCEPFIPMPEMSAVDVGLIEARIREQSQRQLLELQASLPEESTSEAVVRIGRPFLEIVQAAKDLDADLIIISTHGRTGISHVLLGSTAERVAQRADCPVLIVREKEHDFASPRPKLKAPR
ncbi:MAG: universal stress protein [Verrucomicrobiales bacterium]|nr:universal stress protein [Verrucomicrobiales bacterium]